MTTVDEQTEEIGGGGGGGIGAGGGGGGTGMSMTARGRVPRDGSQLGGAIQGSIVPQRGRTWDSSDGLGNPDFVTSMPADFELPRLGLRAGRSIEDYFMRERQAAQVYKFTFTITTKLQEEALTQEEAVGSLGVLEEVTKDVLAT